MSTLSHANSRRMYSWWWDSHISPKNSKWLQENLADMDAKVKAMIKLIEEDADSFARRAEMYYKKRPELMKLVEEFYRAYRALAERYDHATGVIRQAHRTMAEAFPNQVPVLLDDSPASFALGADPSTPHMSPRERALFSPDDLQKDAFELSSSHSPAIKRNGAVVDESDSATSREGLKRLNNLFGPVEHGKFADGRVRKGLNFNEAVDKEQSMQNNENHSLSAQVLPDLDRVDKSEKEIIKLKECLAKLEVEKEAGLVQNQQCLERLSKLESEVSCAQENSRRLSDRAGNAEAEVKALKESLMKLEAEKEASLLQYRQCLDRISALEKQISHAQEDAGELNERASEAEIKAQQLKQDLAKMEEDRDAALLQYNESLELISDLKKKVLQAQEDALIYSERAEKAEREVETIKQSLAKLTEQKEEAALKYQECLDTIADLEGKISFAQKEVQRLNCDIDDRVKKLKDAEERCVLLERSNQSLHTDLEDMLLKMGTQSQELTEKQKELGRLWTCIQEERFRFMEAETAFQTLQNVHSQAQEELRSLASELQGRAHILRDMEAKNLILQDQVLKFKEENKSLSDLNLSSAMSMKEMENVILGLREMKGKLEGEVELRVDQRNALQQEIYCMKEELNALSKKHQALLDQIDAAGLNPDFVESSVKELQVENSNLKESCQMERSEKEALLGKLEILEQLLEKNAILESSLSNLSAQLEGLRGKLKALEESYQALLEEKSMILYHRDSLQSQLQVTAENLGKLSHKNTVLENSISDAHDELESLKKKSESLEVSCLLLANQKTDLVTEKDALLSHLEFTEQKLTGLEKTHRELEEKYSVLEEEKESTLERVKELQVSLDVEKQEHANFVQMSTTPLVWMGTEIRHLQEEGSKRKKEFEEEQDRALHSLVEIFLLQRCVRDLEERNLSLSIECQKLLEASRSSEKLITELEQKNFIQQEEVKFLSDQNTTLTMGMNKLLKSLNIVLDHGYEDKIGKDKAQMSHTLSKLEDMQNTLGKTQDENQHLAVEVSILVTLLGQLRSEMEKLALDQEFRIKNTEILLLETEILKHIEVNEELRSKVREGDQKEELLTAQVENLQKKLLDMQETHQILQKENSDVLIENWTLKEDLQALKGKNCSLEEENLLVFGEMFSLSNLSLMLKVYVTEKILELKELGEDADKLHGANSTLVEKLGFLEKKLKGVQVENLHLKHTLGKSEVEFNSIVTVRDHLNFDLANGKNLQSQKETELLEAEQKLCLKENEKLGFHKIVKDLDRNLSEIQLFREAHERQIFKVSEDNYHLSQDNGSINAANEQMKAELIHLHEECEKAKIREEILLSELQKERNEITMCEMEAEAFFGELQASTICQALLEGKFHELTSACESLEIDSVFTHANIELLKGKVNNLEGENEGLKAQLAACGPPINSLRESIASLEKNSCLHTTVQAMKNEEVKDSRSMNNGVEMQAKQDQTALLPDVVFDLQDLQSGVKSIEQAVFELEWIAMQEHSGAHTNLEAAMRQIELKSKCSSRREYAKQTSKISEAVNGLLTKDIMLDQITECFSFGTSRRGNIEAESQMLELWETADPDSSIDLTVSKGKKVPNKSTDKNVEYRRREAVKKQKDGFAGSDFLVEKEAEKEVGLDKLEISKRSTESYQEGSKRRVLERLNSDVQKLTNLQITVQDLKRKVNITEKHGKGKAVVEFDSLKGQLGEADQAILKLFDYNGKLMESIEDNSLSFDGRIAMGSEESANPKRRKISEQARRVSERIGRLQLEVQRIQFVLLKLDEKESGGITRMTETKRRVLLRDYLYGGMRKSQRRKKAHCCAFVQPPTKGD